MSVYFGYLYMFYWCCLIYPWCEIGADPSNLCLTFHTGHCVSLNGDGVCFFPGQIFFCTRSKNHIIIVFLCFRSNFTLPLFCISYEFCFFLAKYLRNIVTPWILGYPAKTIEVRQADFNVHQINVCRVFVIGGDRSYSFSDDKQ